MCIPQNKNQCLGAVKDLVRVRNSPPSSSLYDRDLFSASLGLKATANSESLSVS